MAFSRPERMEMACIRPGVWRVEGYDVERVKADGKTWWQVFTRYAGEPEVFHGKRPSLVEACDLVWDLMVQSGRAS